MWRFKVEQVWEKAYATVAAPHGQNAAFDRYRHGRQLVKLAGLQPSRRESGERAGRTPITKRGRAQLRAVVYMATLSSLQHNPRIKAHYERLTQRATRPLPSMQAFGACMTKLPHYVFAVVKHQVPFDVDHLWRDTPMAAKQTRGSGTRRRGGLPTAGLSASTRSQLAADRLAPSAPRVRVRMKHDGRLWRVDLVSIPRLDDPHGARSPDKLTDSTRSEGSAAGRARTPGDQVRA